MANKSGKKNKKPLPTTLGKAPCENEKEVDLSHVQIPINTSVFGLKQVLSLFQTATTEVQNYVTYECDIMYECRICRTIFRSLANFILHKRDYCRERFHHLHDKDVEGNDDDLENTQSAPHVEPNQFSSSTENDSTNVEAIKSLSPVIERLKEKQRICQLAQEVLNEDLSTKKDGEPSLDNIKVKNTDLLLEEIATNNAAVFQTVIRNLPKSTFNKKSEFMKAEVMEIHGILDSDEAVLGPDGKICTFKTNKLNENAVLPKNNFFCTECNLKFATKKTLTYHIRYKHNNTRLVYICPDCKDSFANVWCVYRHLFKVHRKTSDQIKRMREQIHNSCVRKDQEPVKKQDKKSSEESDNPDEENQWLNNIEGDNDFQMCGGCGKRFERKAALHSHAQMCTKRIAVCNIIKENNAKKKEEESRDMKNKNMKPEKVKVLKGSSKRKPYLLRTYKPIEVGSCDNTKILPPNDGNSICDLNANCEIVETNCDNSKNLIKEDATQRIPNSLSSSADTDTLSPSRNMHTVSSSIEKLGTDKMLRIIGSSANCNDSVNEYECDLMSPNTDTNINIPDIDIHASVPDAHININSPNTDTNPNALKTDVNVNIPNSVIDPPNIDKNVNIPKTNINQEGYSSGSSHTVSDFDSFCQRVAASLVIDTLDSTEVEAEETQKPTKTVPLILRRRKSTKPEDDNSILQCSKALSRSETTNQDELESVTEVHNYCNENETTVQINDTSKPEKLPSNSNFNISVKSLEDLIGLSPQDHIKNRENKETYMNTTYKNFELNRLPATSIVSDTCDAVITEDYLEQPLAKDSKCVKRKRTCSFDSTGRNRISKLSRRNILLNKQDINFISKASPFMDQNKHLCIPCQSTYPTLSKLLWHMSAHFSWFRFQCSRCSFISFNKLDCANHARKTHRIKKTSIQSVVLPIPNWKTVLMSHDFCILNDDSDLTGKHTDEVISADPEEDAIIVSLGEKMKHIECNEPDCSVRLFAESQNLVSEPENDPLECDSLLNCGSSMKQDNIDVIADVQESFQIEVPQEIYTFEIIDLIEDVNYEERSPYDTCIKVERDDDDEDEEDLDISACIAAHKKNNKPFVDTEIKIASEVETNGKLSIKNAEDDEYIKEHSQLAVNTRPTRKRTKSIKITQDDFCYDLDLRNIIKLNATSISKSHLQRHKKIC
ncbi:hypothetical protein NQ315_012119 [Exocentrus adspersus]|uniref:C2H2-type domain-containing protein n=1 Tax=Exocentrus adspersus TaxID=1586481 RepID=A0AAV8VXY9_9CUCU|nr:hypothetical protein NQ315_012119 [Exocentrus adspersus]